MALSSLSHRGGGGSATLYVSTTGNDSTGNGSVAAPFATITHAAAVATSGATVIVESGTYHEAITITTSGVTVRSQSPLGAILAPPADLSGTSYTLVEIGPLVYPNSCANIVFDGFDIDGANTNPGQVRLGIYTNCNNVVIQHNRVRNIALTDPAKSVALGGQGGAGIQVDGFYGNFGGTIQDNTIGNSGVLNPSTSLVHGIYLETRGTMVFNNLIYNVPSGDGITSWHGADQLVIANNTIFLPHNGILIGASPPGGSHYVSSLNDNSMVFNNIVVNGSGSNGTGYAFAQSGSATYPAAGSVGPNSQVDYNIANNFVTAPYAFTNITAGSHGLIGDPEFVNYDPLGPAPDGSGDYHIINFGPPVDAGTPSLGGQAAPALAFDGTVRPVGPAFDMGIYERTNTGSAPQTWSPTQSNTHNSLSNTNLTTTTNAGTIRATTFGSKSATSGKIYWETVDTYNRGGGTPSGANTWGGSGIGNTSSTVADGHQVGDDPDTIGYNVFGPLNNNNAAMTLPGDSVGLPAYNSGSRIAQAIDLGAHLYWVKNCTTSGNWNGSPTADPASGVGGVTIPSAVYAHPVVPGVTLYNGAAPADTATGYFASSSWACSGGAPSGFGQW